MDGRLIVISYDVADDRRRLRLANALKDFGVRVQYSVFECRLDAAQLEKLRNRLVKLVDLQEDSVYLYRLCLACGARQEVYGREKPGEETDVYIL